MIATVSPEQSMFPGISVVKEGFKGVLLETTVNVFDTVHPLLSSATTVMTSLFFTVKLATEVVVETVAFKVDVDDD